jgi:hypothetical protein
VHSSVGGGRQGSAHVDVAVHQNQCEQRKGDGGKAWVVNDLPREGRKRERPLRGSSIPFSTRQPRMGTGLGRGVEQEALRRGAQQRGQLVGRGASHLNVVVFRIDAPDLGGCLMKADQLSMSNCCGGAATLHWMRIAEGLGRNAKQEARE